METIIEVKPQENYSIWVRFSDNYIATVNIKPFCNSKYKTIHKEWNFC